MSNYGIIKEAIFTERTTTLSEKQNTYTFKVIPHVNKLQIKEAIEKAFNVKVAVVRTINMRPKIRIDRYRGLSGKTKRFKKAIVKLEKGYSIEFV